MSQKQIPIIEWCTASSSLSNMKFFHFGLPFVVVNQKDPQLMICGKITNCSTETTIDLPSLIVKERLKLYGNDSITFALVACLPGDTSKVHVKISDGQFSFEMFFSVHYVVCDEVCFPLKTLVPVLSEACSTLFVAKMNDMVLHDIHWICKFGVGKRDATAEPTQFFQNYWFSIFKENSFHVASDFWKIVLANINNTTTALTILHWFSEILPGKYESLIPAFKREVVMDLYTLYLLEKHMEPDATWLEILCVPAELLDTVRAGVKLLVPIELPSYYDIIRQI